MSRGGHGDGDGDGELELLRYPCAEMEEKDEGAFCKRRDDTNEGRLVGLL